MRTVLALGVVAVTVVVGACGDDPPQAEPGEVVDREAVTIAVGDDRLSGIRVEYGSVGAAGGRIDVTGMVFVPEGEPPADGWPVIAYGHGTTGGADRCAPSREPNVAELALRVAAFVDAGYVVAATDYEGLGSPGSHAYLDGTSAARTMADAVRAARAVVPDTGTRWAAFGHSQGGHAALFTAEQAAEHAPELDLVGAVASAPAADLPALLQNPLLGRHFEALLLGSWFVAEPGLDRRELTEAGRAAVEAVNRRCDVGTMGQAFATPQAAEAFGAFLSANVPGQAPTDVPLLVVQGGGDQLVTPAMTEAVVDRLCGLGDDVELVVDDGSDHETVFAVAVRIAVDWLADRFADRPTTPSCAPG